MEERQLSLSEVAGLMGVSERTVRRWIKSGKLRAYKPGRDYRIPESAFQKFVAESEISPKVPASSSQQPTLNGELEAERRAEWGAAVEEARRVRETGGPQMWNALSEWRASKKRGEAYATRRKYLDEMGSLLQEVYDAETALVRALADPLDLAAVNLDEFAELQAASRFYGELRGMVEGQELHIRTERASQEGEAAQEAERAQEGRPEAVEEREVA